MKISETENKKQKKFNETKSWFFEKVNKTDKPLVRLSKEKRRGLKIRNERRDITTDIIEIQRIMRLL